jgi:hypothetical protein
MTSIKLFQFVDICLSALAWVEVSHVSFPRHQLVPMADSLSLPGETLETGGTGWSSCSQEDAALFHCPQDPGGHKCSHFTERQYAGRVAGHLQVQAGCLGSPQNLVDSQKRWELFKPQATVWEISDLISVPGESRAASVPKRGQCVCPPLPLSVLCCAWVIHYPGKNKTPAASSCRRKETLQQKSQN